ncbi:ribonuclease P/MRP protein subunit POP5 [Rhodotorula toruloides]|uniref:Ribonuclease P/MRP protein subunit POP5 n=1 Tax=Rhodotorula toruloides TaxID=5286 RepID=A0A511KLU5_RHOTO|nr:ribonuclease P/MRP protein subunit POP5 [Rhodotorula toruloides]
MVRFKHRYLLLHLLFPAAVDLDTVRRDSDANQPPSESTFSPPHLSESSLISLLRDSLSVNFGDIGAGEVGGTFSIKYLSPSTSTVIIRVSREHFRTLWAALTLLRRVGGQECVARVVHVSGTIRKTQHAAIAHDRTQILLSAARKRSAAARQRKREAVKPVEAGAEDKVVEKQLTESEEKILAIEA